MASRRMFASKIITTDRFQSMSRDSQFLYIHFAVAARRHAECLSEKPREV